MANAERNPRLSVVIPVYGSAHILPELARRLEVALAPEYGDGFEVVLVDDCGPGGSWEVIRELAASRPWLRGIALRKNAGQHNAIMAGLHHARGDVIVTMDDDLQHAPSDIPALVRAVEAGHDVCYTRFRHREHALWKRLGSALNDRVARFLIGTPKGVYLSPFKAMRREIRDELVRYTGPHVYLDGQIVTVTSSIATLEVEHHARHLGDSNYSLRRSISLWLRVLTNFSVAPLRVASFVGLVFSITGFLLALYFIVGRLLGKPLPEGWTSLAVIVLIMGGIQLTALGAIGEYVGRVFLNVNRRPQFVVGRTVNVAPGDSPAPGSPRIPGSG